MNIMEFIPFLTNIYYKWKKLFNFNNVDLKEKENRISIAFLVFFIITIYSFISTLFIDIFKFIISCQIYNNIISRILFSILGFIISYQMYYTFGVHKTGDVAFGMIKYNNIHIHHWMYSLFILIISLFTNIYHPFLTGLCFGGIINGIQFSDWLTIYN